MAEPTVIETLGRILQQMEAVCPRLDGCNRRAMRGAASCVSYIQTVILTGEAPERPLWGIERSLPEGDRD